MVDEMGRCENCGKITPEGDLEEIKLRYPKSRGPGNETELWCKGCRDENW